MALGSAALVVDKCSASVSDPHHKSVCRQSQSANPSAPAHSARPPQNVHGPGFCDFQKPPRNLLRICIKSVSCKPPFVIFYAQAHAAFILLQNCASRCSGTHNLAYRLQVLSIKIIPAEHPNKGMHSVTNSFTNSLVVYYYE